MPKRIGDRREAQRRVADKPADSSKTKNTPIYQRDSENGRLTSNTRKAWDQRSKKEDRRAGPDERRRRRKLVPISPDHINPPTYMLDKKTYRKTVKKRAKQFPNAIRNFPVLNSKTAERDGFYEIIESRNRKKRGRRKTDK